MREFRQLLAFAGEPDLPLSNASGQGARIDQVRAAAFSMARRSVVTCNVITRDSGFW